MELYVSVPSAHTREALIKSARAGSERFCSQARFGKRRNTLCISHFSNRSMGAKDPLSSRRRFIQSFPRSEVRKHERGRKEVPFLGSGRPKAAGDSVRPAGKPDPELTGCPLNRSRRCGTVRITLVPVTIPGSSENDRRTYWCGSTHGSLV